MVSIPHWHIMAELSHQLVVVEQDLTKRKQELLVDLVVVDQTLALKETEQQIKDMMDLLLLEIQMEVVVEQVQQLIQVMLVVLVYKLLLLDHQRTLELVH